MSDSATLQKGDAQPKCALETTAESSDRPFQRIDHIALAVNDLEAAVHTFRDVLGFVNIDLVKVDG